MEKNTYETPIIEIIEINSDQSIAASAEDGAAYWEELL